MDVSELPSKGGKRLGGGVAAPTVCYNEASPAMFTDNLRELTGNTTPDDGQFGKFTFGSDGSA